MNQLQHTPRKYFDLSGFNVLTYRKQGGATLKSLADAGYLQYGQKLILLYRKREQRVGQLSYQGTILDQGREYKNLSQWLVSTNYTKRKGKGWEFTYTEDGVRLDDLKRKYLDDCVKKKITALQPYTTFDKDVEVHVFEMPGVSIDKVTIGVSEIDGSITITGTRRRWYDTCELNFVGTIAPTMRNFNLEYSSVDGMLQVILRRSPSPEEQIQQ
jgi:hypothetical protein